LPEEKGTPRKSVIIVAIPSITSEWLLRQRLWRPELHEQSAVYSHLLWEEIMEFSDIGIALNDAAAPVECNSEGVES
jgi:hypothetical protein